MNKEKTKDVSTYGRAKFPIKTILGIIGERTYKANNKLREALYANAAAIPMTLGGGRNGHISLLTDVAVYSNVDTTAYARSTEPGSYTQHGPGASAAAQVDTNEIHKEGRIIYNLDNKVDAAIRQKIIAAVEETYLSAKRQRYMRFHGVSSKNLVDHLMERYGKIRASDLKACRQALAEPIEVYLPINVYFRRVKDVIQFAQDGNTPFTPANIFQKEYHAVNKIGLYSLALKYWRKKLMADKTWASC